MVQLTVVVSTYNRAALLDGVLQSLANQTIGKELYEILIVDNASTDNTKAVAKNFLQYENFRYIYEPNQGLSYARNRGYKEAHGEYVAYIDDDALASKQWLERILAFVKKHPEVSAFGGPYRQFSLVKIPAWYKDIYGSWSLGDKERLLENNEWINGTNMIYKRAVLEEMGGFNSQLGMSGNKISYGEETNLLIRLRKQNHPIYYVPDIVVEHLIAEYKLNLKWMFKSYFASGYEWLLTFNKKGKFIVVLLQATWAGIYGIIKFIFSREKYIKARFFESFKVFAWCLGVLKYKCVVFMELLTRRRYKS